MGLGTPPEHTLATPGPRSVLGGVFRAHLGIELSKSGLEIAEHSSFLLLEKVIHVSALDFVVLFHLGSLSVMLGYQLLDFLL